MSDPSRLIKLGDLLSSRQGLGCVSLNNWAYKTDVTKDQAIQLVHHCIKNGVTHFDTAEVYGPYESEKILGEALKEVNSCGIKTRSYEILGERFDLTKSFLFQELSFFRSAPVKVDIFGLSDVPRDQVLVATKTGFVIENGTFTGEVCGKPEFVRKALMGSLERLQMDYVDLYYLHRIDTQTPIEETMKELKALVKEGKIKHIGLSEASAKTIEAAHKIHPIAAVQLEWTLWVRDVEETVIPKCRELGIGIVVYSPLGRGLSTGAIKSPSDLDPSDLRNSLPRFAEGNFEKNRILHERVEKFASEKHCTPGQISLAWILAQGDDVCPIPGTSKIAHFDENLKANEIVLSPEEVQILNELVPPNEVLGDRSLKGLPSFQDN